MDKCLQLGAHRHSIHFSICKFRIWYSVHCGVVFGGGLRTQSSTPIGEESVSSTEMYVYIVYGRLMNAVKFVHYLNPGFYNQENMLRVSKVQLHMTN